MKRYFKFLTLIIVVSLTSCRTIVSNPGKLLKDNSLEINQKYEVQDFTAKIYKIKIISIDSKKIYGISKKGDCISIDKKEIREVKRVRVMSSIAVGLMAIAAVIFVPI
ncbi:bacteriophage spanin2 family protein [Chryseobacterium sp. LC2016-27]|uniref:bacteriophage spanin2 family protein n=1 Tax=Chryseobacterium sp. LC2016-27 TaxID=2897326 RepID=UPI001E453E3F|nr:bacteriophage spanin2 family protein [Chryseobacterium sp. LC2016-27]MCD0456308.1 bacteriophage spanin2 family protein [Chryseobacterium sp. LC2016-27]